VFLPGEVEGRVRGAVAGDAWDEERVARVVVLRQGRRLVFGLGLLDLLGVLRLDVHPAPLPFALGIGRGEVGQADRRRHRRPGQARPGGEPRERGPPLTLAVRQAPGERPGGLAGGGHRAAANKKTGARRSWVTEGGGWRSRRPTGGGGRRRRGRAPASKTSWTRQRLHIPLAKCG